MQILGCLGMYFVALVVFVTKFSPLFRLALVILCYKRPHYLRMNYYIQKIGELRSQWNSAQMNNRHPWQLKKIYILGAFWSYQLNSTANSAHLPPKLAKWAEFAVLFSWQLQIGPHDFDFFNCHGCRLFI